MNKNRSEIVAFNYSLSSIVLLKTSVMELQPTIQESFMPCSQLTVEDEMLNDLLSYLFKNRKDDFKKRTLSVIERNFVKNRLFVEEGLSRLCRDGFIRIFLHPEIGLYDDLNIDTKSKVFYAISTKGRVFMKEGGY